MYGYARSSGQDSISNVGSGEGDATRRGVGYVRYYLSTIYTDERILQADDETRDDKKGI